ncbi:MAG TPA: YjbQ family protein [Pelagibacteraceae bacterium]|jgi:secondary thiamine-phosphate synthase enzyme|uniref:Secondary thiamine-phosphate synthase enzyme n=1 Tax=marine metagenome TaxID=408172 RepID=A0A382BPX2_9ZZZZ|nr:YjbQ family protein [Pelagibacteraceae bacterium]|tara:strand:+ start:140 stop:556 length:417 start_codon:yes stop_codon:yes gene_type:complete
MQIFYELIVKTKGQGLYDFTKETIDWVKKQKIHSGILNLNILHTSASLTIQENADPDVLYDIKNFFDKLVPMNNDFYKHTTEGIDDMPAHLKTMLTNTQLTLSVKNKKPILGTWQGLYLFEHRLENQNRTISHHLMGD